MIRIQENCRSLDEAHRKATGNYCPRSTSLTNILHLFFKGTDHYD